MAEDVLEMLCIDLTEIFGEGGRKGGILKVTNKRQLYRSIYHS